VLSFELVVCSVWLLVLPEAGTRKHAKNGGYSYCPISKLLLSFKIHIKMPRREKMNAYNKEIKA